MVPQFNSDYWLAVAAAGPVLALSNTLTLTGWTRGFLEYYTAGTQTAEHRRLSPEPFRLVQLGQSVAFLNYTLQAVATIVALVSLEDRQAVMPAWQVTIAIAVSFVVIATMATAAGRLSATTYVWTSQRRAAADADD